MIYKVKKSRSWILPVVAGFIITCLFGVTYFLSESSDEDKIKMLYEIVSTGIQFSLSFFGVWITIYTIVTGFSDSYSFLKNNEIAYSLFKDNICLALISCACLLIFCFIAKFMFLLDCEYLSFALATFILFCATALIVFATREFITIFKIKKTSRNKE